MSLLNQLFAIVTLRGKPQDLPGSPSLVWLSGASAAASAMAIRLQQFPVGRSALSSLSEVVLLGAVIWGVLALRGYPARWMQTITPLYVCMTLGNFAMLLTLLGSDYPLEAGHSGLAALVIIGTGVWFLMVMAHVLRYALEMGLGVSLLIALACLFPLTVLLMVMFPYPPPVQP